MNSSINTLQYKMCKKTNNLFSRPIMQVKSIAECFKESIMQFFRPALSYYLSLRSLSIFQWLFYTGFAV